MSWRTTEISAESLRFANADGFLMLEEMDEMVDLSTIARAEKPPKADGKKSKKAATADAAPADGKKKRSRQARKGDREKEKQKKRAKAEAAATAATAAVAADAVDDADPAEADDADEQTTTAPAAPPATAAAAASTAGPSAWEALGLHAELVGTLTRQGFTTPTPIQQACLPAALHGRRDVVGAAETGSGKTLAFALPILQRLLDAQDEAAAGGPAAAASGAPFALVLTPTRELAVQVAAHTRAVLPAGRGAVAVGVGGMALEKQKRQLGARPEVVVATPGRLWELVSEHTVAHLQRLHRLRFFVLDEVDRMVSVGHFRELTHILNLVQRTPDDDDVADDDDGGGGGGLRPLGEAFGGRQTLLFSATLTLPPAAREANAKRLKKHKPLPESSGSSIEALLGRVVLGAKPKVVDLSRKQLVAEKLEQARLSCVAGEKDAHLVLLLRERKGRAIVFTNAVSALRRLKGLLGALNMPVLVLQGGMQQRARLKAYDRFASSEHATLLATDVAARGLDFSGVDYVVHYQLPRSSETYVHRSGRTARAAAAGLSVVLLEPSDAKDFRRLLHEMGEDDLPDLRVDRKPLSAIKAAVSLAAQLDRQQHRERRDKANDNFATSLASEMGLPSESEDDADEETELNARRAERQQTNDTARLKAQLADAMRRLEPSAAKDARESGKIPTRPGKRKRPGFS